jgi:hypothetical protein
VRVWFTRKAKTFCYIKGCAKELYILNCYLVINLSKKIAKASNFVANYLKAYSFIKKYFMLNQEKVEELLERLGALRRYL